MNVKSDCTVFDPYFDEFHNLTCEILMLLNWSVILISDEILVRFGDGWMDGWMNVHVYYILSCTMCVPTPHTHTRLFMLSGHVFNLNIYELFYAWPLEIH